MIVKGDPRLIVNNDQQHFYGYYDISPYSQDEQFIITHEYARDVYQDGIVGIDVLVIRLIDGVEVFRKTTYAWNYQQGSLAQWLGPCRDTEIIYNDIEFGKPISRVANILTGEIRKLETPIYALLPNGLGAFTVNFNKIRYSYNGLEQCDLDNERDGLFYFDFVTSRKTLIVDLKFLIDNFGKINMGTGEHWLEHVMINPAGNRLLFLHRYQLMDGAFSSRLMTCDVDGQNIYMLSEGMVSHMCWKNNSEIVAWARGGLAANYVRRKGYTANPVINFIVGLARKCHGSFIRQRLIGDSYICFKDRSSDYKKIGVGKLIGDGHCTYTKDGAWMLTDTYPDERSMRHLYLYSDKLDRLISLGDYFSPINEGYFRCDLHPRLSPSERFVCFDSAHSGKRQAYQLEIELPK